MIERHSHHCREIGFNLQTPLHDQIRSGRFRKILPSPTLPAPTSIEVSLTAEASAGIRKILLLVKSHCGGANPSGGLDIMRLRVVQVPPYNSDRITVV